MPCFWYCLSRQYSLNLYSISMSILQRRNKTWLPNRLYVHLFRYNCFQFKNQQRKSFWNEKSLITFCNENSSSPLFISHWNKFRIGRMLCEKFEKLFQEYFCCFFISTQLRCFWNNFHGESLGIVWSEKFWQTTVSKVLLRFRFGGGNEMLSQINTY